MANLTVHFKKPDGWADTIHVYYWDTRPLRQATDWPGAAMTAEPDGWFVYTFNGIEAAQIVFNDARSRQTDDMHRDRGGWFDTNGQWSDKKPKAPAKGKSPGQKGACKAQARQCAGRRPVIRLPRGDHLFPAHHAVL